jgi:hypothetical protein
MTTLPLARPASLRGVPTHRLASELLTRAAAGLAALVELLLRPAASRPRPLRMAALAALAIATLSIAVETRNGALAAAVGPVTVLALLCDRGLRAD